MNEMEGVRAQIPTVPWWLMLITGIAPVVLGIFLIIAPVQTVVALVQFLGAYWLITGVFSIVSIIIDRSNWVWKLFSGILGIAAGAGILVGSALLVMAFV